MNFRQIINSQSKTITSAAFLLMTAALASRFLGLIRDRILAGKFGAGEELDIYYAAFRIPDLVYSILIMGAISSAFIPIFTQYWNRDHKEAWKLANGLLNLAFLGLIALSVLLIILSPLLIPLVAPGFEGQKQDLTVMLTRIMFLSPILFGLSAVFSGILHSFRRFLVYSLAPIMYNLGIIFGAVFLTQFFGVLGLAWGVVLGAFLHMAIQIPSTIISGFRYQWLFDIYNAGIRKIVKLMIPRSLGLAAFQINLIVITAIASFLTSGSIAVFNFSNNLQYLPIGIIGISFATAAFPALSHYFTAGRKKDFIQNFSSVFRQIIFLVIPLSVLLFLLRAQIVRIVLGTGEFGWIDTRLTAASLGLFSLGIFAQSLIPLVSRAFYAMQNTKIPVTINTISIGINILLSILFVYFLTYSNIFYNAILNILKLQGIQDIAVVGLPLALSLSGIINLLILLFALYIKFGNYQIRRIVVSLMKIIIASALMGLMTYWNLYLISQWVDMQTLWGILIQSSAAALFGISVYVLVSVILKSKELYGLKISLTRQFLKKAVIPQENGKPLI